MLWVGLGTGYSIVGWVGRVFNIICSMGVAWVQVEMYGFGLGVS